MLQSQLFTKVRRENPRDEASRGAALLLRAGYIHKEMAGAYSYLPLGWRVLNKIMAIIREEMDTLGAQELQLTALQEPEKWLKTGRWSEEVVDIWFKTKLASGSELGLANTHEEPVTSLMAEYLQSYQDLPLSVYQFQTKFRNELRAKSGIMRTREFIMKDLYSFHRTQEELDNFYNQVADAYRHIFGRVGLGGQTYYTFASGGAFSKYSHEFQTICAAGEDTIYVDEDKKIAVNVEVCQDEVLKELGLEKDSLLAQKSIEVGNIFKLGTRFSESLGLTYTDEAGTRQPVFMGSYGIGPGRVMGTVAELLADDNGLVWPASIAPFSVHLIQVASQNPQVAEAAQNLYRTLTQAGIEVLYDDRTNFKAGEQFAESDILGLPYRVVVSERQLAAGTIELKTRAKGEIKALAPEELIKTIHAAVA